MTTGHFETYDMADGEATGVVHFFHFGCEPDGAELAPMPVDAATRCERCGDDLYSPEVTT